MTSHTDIVQTSLSEDLFYLGKFRSSSGQVRHPFANQQELILNTVALYMTTGRPDGVIATFFHETPFTLYLAKSGPLSHEDPDMATSFFACLKDATKFAALLPFLARYSAKNVEKRVRNLCQSFEDIFPELSELALEHQENTALESLKSVLRSSFTFDNTTEAHDSFLNIVAASNDLLKVFSSFEHANASKYGIIIGLSGLKRHLQKVVQYRDVKQLIWFVRRNDLKITVLWVPDKIPTPRQIFLDTGRLADRHLDSFLAWAVKDIDSDGRAELRRLMASTLSYFEHASEVTLYVHPEIRLIMYLTDVVGVQKQYPLGTELYIGSSKRICGSCNRWIEAFNKCLNMKWTTTYVNHQMKCNWRIPDPDLTHDIQAAVRQANDTVLEGVKRGMEQRLFQELDEALDTLSYIKYRKLKDY